MDEIDQGSATEVEIVTTIAIVIGIETEKETGIGIEIEIIATTGNMTDIGGRKDEGHLLLC
jgi:hypothetical protein